MKIIRCPWCPWRLIVHSHLEITPEGTPQLWAVVDSHIRFHSAALAEEVEAHLASLTTDTE